MLLPDNAQHLTWASGTRGQVGLPRWRREGQTACTAGHEFEKGRDEWLFTLEELEGSA